MDTETTNLEELVLQCEDELVSDQQKMSDLIENIRICETVNSARQVQINVWETHLLPSI